MTNAAVGEALEKCRSAAELYAAIPQQPVTTNYQVPISPTQSTLSQAGGHLGIDARATAAAIMQILPTTQQGATPFRLLKPTAANNSLLQPPVPLAKMTATSTTCFLQAQRKASAEMLQEGSIKMMGLLFLRMENEATPPTKVRYCSD